ncbi:putative cellulose synthase [Synechococcus phage S-CBWM1]|uniref:cellulose synthase (UDP-forming) n=1 Tax=Synechococcus phage S-CBWM1 TaxID=2053653 RepID=A0A3G1L3T1_9CAUD|nr:putative cellulose synthase [Synechococcus phage S-CBWM1]ATW62842.1 putative cellulose synthase [Synechococcus phage S-CBWM1]
MRYSISPRAWGFFLLSALIFLVTIGLSNLNFGWIDPIQLNAMATATLPELFQVPEGPGGIIVPVVALSAVLVTIHLLPRNKYTIAFAQGSLLFVGTRYIVWRALTLNTAHPFSLILSLSVFLYEAMFVLTAYAEFFPSTTFNPLKRRKQADSYEEEVAKEEHSVDVFIATYNESTRQIRRCVLAAKALHYGNKTIYILDDGSREEIRELAERLGVGYITRDTNEHRKAGNLNNAFKQTSGEFLLSLDCDFVPFQNILGRTLGFFSDPNVAIVQTPQHYFMPDFHSRNLGVEGIMPSDTDMFYHYQQVIRDNFNAVVCVGTSYVARRSALESVGGYVTTCIIEDHQTGTKLIANGWRIVYLDEILSVGETPSRFRDYVDQRLRWLQGNLQILLPKSGLNVLGNPDLSIWQKVFYTLHYDSNFLPVGRTLFIFVPLISLYFGNLLIVAPVWDYLSYAIPFVLFLHIVPSWVSGGHIHQIWHEVYETIMCVPWTIRTLKIFRNPFNIFGSTVTPKDVKGDGKSFDLKHSRHLVVYLILLLVFFLLRFGLPLINPSLQFYQSQSEGQEILVLWSIYNLVMVLVALLCCIEKPSRRTSERFPVNLVVRAEEGSRSFWGTAEDMSETGILLSVTTKNADLHSLGEKLNLFLVDYDICVRGSLVKVINANGPRTKVSIRFDNLSEAQETRILQIIYSKDNEALFPETVSTLGAILLFFKSLFKSSSFLQVF